MTIKAASRRPEVAAGMAAARQKGVRLGRPRVGLPSSAGRIDELREQGLSLAAIADTLGKEKVPTLSGRGSWSKSSVSYVLDRIEQHRNLTAGTRPS